MLHTFFAGTLLLVACFLSACASAPPAPPESASCLSKQNHCLDVCKTSQSNRELGTAVGLLLAKPSTPAERQRASNASQQNKAQDARALEQCRAGCDTKAERCRQLR